LPALAIHGDRTISAFRRRRRRRRRRRNKKKGRRRRRRRRRIYSMIRIQ